GGGERRGVWLGGGGGGDERAAAARRLHDHRAQRDAGDHAVADGEVHRQRRRAGRELAEDQPALFDGAEQTPVRVRVDDVDPRAEDGDGGAVRVERGRV